MSPVLSILQTSTSKYEIYSQKLQILQDFSLSYSLLILFFILKFYPDFSKFISRSISNFTLLFSFAPVHGPLAPGCF